MFENTPVIDEPIFTNVSPTAFKEYAIAAISVADALTEETILSAVELICIKFRVAVFIPAEALSTKLSTRPNPKEFNYNPPFFLLNNFLYK